MFEFDASTHSYTVGGSRIPSVTQLLSGIDSGYAYVNDKTMEYARQRGLAVHKACELLDLDDLEESSLSPVIVPYVAAYRRFKVETGFIPRLIEKRFVHPVHKFAGMLDRVGVLFRKHSQIDLKAVASISDATALQTAAYSELCRAAGELVEERRALQLRPDGTYRLTDPYTDPDDFRVFLSLINLARWKEKAKC